jgi:hypothetical protein
MSGRDRKTAEAGRSYCLDYSTPNAQYIGDDYTGGKFEIVCDNQRLAKSNDIENI